MAAKVNTLVRKREEQEPQQIYTGFTGTALFTPQQKKKTLLDTYFDNLRGEKMMDLDEWSDKYRVLPSETSAEYGEWRTSRFPFLKKIMKALSPSSKAREIVAMKGAQLGFTELAINWMMYSADQDPGPMMYIQKTKEAAEDFSTQKLVPNIEICKKVTKTLGKGKPKHLSNTTFNKGYPGGYVVLGGSNSGAFLRSKSISRAVADEEDSFSLNVDGEGSPIFMVRKRLSNFPDSKFFRLSTPKIHETSTINDGYITGSQEQFYVPCPHCNPDADINKQYDTIRWGNITWMKDKHGNAILDESGVPDGIGLVCECCGELIEEHHKTWMLRHGEWMSVKGLDKNDPYARPYIVGDVEFPSFHLNSLYSPFGFFSWRDAVKEYWDYHLTKDKGILQGFINQTLGEPFKLTGQIVSNSVLHGRREEYDPLVEVPYQCVCVTAGVDIQGDRIEMEVVGHGLNNETFSLEFKVFFGETSSQGGLKGVDSQGNPTAWALLDSYLYSKYKHPSGYILPIECTFIDMGYLADIVRAFCAPRQQSRKIFPVRGSDGWGRGFIEKPKRAHPKWKTWEHVAYVDELKELFYSQLLIDVPGTGYCHFPITDDYTEKYFQELVSEQKEVITHGGKKKIKWVVTPGVRNEPLDCRNYAIAALKAYPIVMENRYKLLNPTDNTTQEITQFMRNMVLQKPDSKRKIGVVSKGI